MARGAEAHAAMVASADLRLAEAGVPNPPRHADISRSDLSSLFIQTRGVLKKELTAQLRTARGMRRPKSHNAKSGQPIDYKRCCTDRLKAHVEAWHCRDWDWQYAITQDGIKRYRATPHTISRGTPCENVIA